MNSPEISVHDNVVKGYSVLCEERKIVIHTAFREREPHEQTDVIFRDVEAYYIANDNLKTILFDITECPFSELLAEYASEFETGVKYCWPGAWNKSPEACSEFLTKNGSRGWTIDSSIGMTGFIIARSMEMRSVESGA
jgi:hypothetical protein